MEQLGFKGEFYLEAFSREGRRLWGLLVPNAPVIEGLTDILSTNFNDGTKKTQWFIRLIDSAGFDELDADDTLASHPGWSELTSYSGSGKQWTPLTAAGALITNTTPAEFSFTAACTVKGVLVCSAASGTSGVLWSTAALAAARSFQAGQSLRVTYTLRAAGGN
jgi:hypothetical protein